MAGAGDASLLHYFRKGAEVEISSDDAGFRGSLYEGTVIRPPTAHSSKVLVQYKTLTANEAGTRPLKESLELIHLRPRQPTENRLAFNFSDEVDAYHNDGWWEGIVTELPDAEGKYMVFFRGTREQLKFTASQLRLHREWVRGKWVPPLEPSSSDERTPLSAATEATEEVGETEYVYNPGDLMEASSEEEGLEGAWLGATVLEMTTAGKYMIQYQHLRNDNDTDFLKEEVDTLYLRPRPPVVEKLDSFFLKEEVDAWYQDCWWVGEISKILKNDRYTVFFKNTDEEIKFEHSDLRVHQEWKNGKWHIAS